jgi:protein tyrosine/serine phosphatase
VWIELDGAANTRDLGGLPTEDGRHTQPDRLIRSDNLQSLSKADVRSLVDEHGVRTIADLRTEVEVASEGPGPMLREPLVQVSHFSLFPEAGVNTDAAAVDDGPVVLPWQDESLPRRGGMGASGIYLGYLEDRTDSVLAALRLIAQSPGATVVHCAAGKDRTGVVVAAALSEVGVMREAIVADYARSGERIEAIFARLQASRTYVDDVAQWDLDRHRPKPETMRQLLADIDEQLGGIPAWLRRHKWSEADAAALRRKLLD